LHTHEEEDEEERGETHILAFEGRRRAEKRNLKDLLDTDSQ